jgi:hypothetical protein
VPDKICNLPDGYELAYIKPDSYWNVSRLSESRNYVVKSEGYLSLVKQKTNRIVWCVSCEENDFPNRLCDFLYLYATLCPETLREFEVLLGCYFGICADRQKLTRHFENNFNAIFLDVFLTETNGIILFEDQYNQICNYFISNRSLAKQLYRLRNFSPHEYKYIVSSANSRGIVLEQFLDDRMLDGFLTTRDQWSALGLYESINCLD